MEMNKQSTLDRVSFCLALGLVLVCFAACLWQVVSDLSAGGHSYRQGDWLINIHAGFVRRGLLGSGLLLISDILNVSPLSVVAFVQAVLVTLFFGFLIRILYLIPWSAGQILLIVSPASVVMLWLADYDGRLMKEIIAYAAIAALVYGLAVRSSVAVSAAGLGFAIACIAHEASTVLFPAFAVIMLSRRRAEGDHWICAGSLAIASFGALAAGLISIGFTSADDFQAVCTEVTSRGVGPNICRGAIAWLGNDIEMAQQLVQNLIMEFGPVRWGLLFVLSVIGLGVYSLYLDRPALAIGLLIASFVVVSPLYVVAIDWGRWTNVSVTAFGFVMFHLLIQERIAFRHEPPGIVLTGLVGVSFVYSPSHVIETSWGVAGELGKLVLR